MLDSVPERSRSLLLCIEMPLSPPLANAIRSVRYRPCGHNHSGSSYVSGERAFPSRGPGAYQTYQCYWMCAPVRGSWSPSSFCAILIRCVLHTQLNADRSSQSYVRTLPLDVRNILDKIGD